MGRLQVMSHAGIRLLAVILLSGSCRAQDCPNSTLPSYVKEWTERSSPDNKPAPVSVQWHITDSICHSFSSCFGINGVTKEMEPQLTPLVLQPGTNLTFSVNQHLGLNFTMKVFWVTEELFRSCDTANGTVGKAVNKELTAGDIYVDPKNFLRPGENYFIAVTNMDMISCNMGLRLNVTVKEEHCRKPGVTRMCTGRGHCVTSALQTDFECSCCPGYSGRYCEGRDACTKKPCPSNATCIDDVADLNGTKYHCICPPGFSGTTCESRTDDMCTTLPCQNNASCSGNATSYSCHCLPGFEGHHCEININDCSKNPCVHGECHDRVGSYYCECIPGHGGKNCEHKYNKCLSQPCQHGGFCKDKEDAYECHCNQGYTGPNCNQKVPLCDPSPCQNAIECVDHGARYSCTCLPGFTGKTCEINMNECESSPCHQGATCVDMVAGFKCLCPPSLTGERCHHKAHPNLPRPPDLLQYPHISIRRSHVHNLWIIAGTLLGALLIAVLVMAVCYCRFYGIRGPTSQFRYKQHQDEVRKRSESVKEGGPSLEAILEASNCDQDSTSLNVPLVRGLRSQKI